MARTPKGHAVRKSRRAHREEPSRSCRGVLASRLYCEDHTVAECDNPDRDPMIASAQAEGKRASNRANVERDARDLIAIVRREPGMGERDLRDALRTEGHRWGRERLSAATRKAKQGIAGSRLSNRGDGRLQSGTWRPPIERAGAPMSSVPRVPGTVRGTPKGAGCPVRPAPCRARHRCAARATLSGRAARHGGNRHKMRGRRAPPLMRGRRALPYKMRGRRAPPLMRGRRALPLCSSPRERLRAATACTEARECER